MTIPITAYHFISSMPQLREQDVDGKQYAFDGLAYSGKALSHPYWGQVIFDLSSTQAANDKTPILIDHDPGKRAGFAQLNFANNQIAISGGTLLDNEHGNQIINESQQGFPWQMSVYIDPSRVEEIQAGDTVNINGQIVNGPATIFKNSVIREVSFTAIGVDSSTKAKAMSHQQHQPESTMTEEQIAAMKTENQELADSVAELKTSLTSANETAQAATAALNEHKETQRMSAVQELFKETGREYTDDAAKPYLDMTEGTFSVISADLKAAQPKPDPNLFSQQARDGQDPDADQQETDKEKLNFSSIYEKRRIN